MHFISTLVFLANGNICWWWDQVDFTVLYRYLRCFFFFFFFFFFFLNFCNIFVSSVDCLLLIQIMYIFIISLCSTTSYWRRQRKTANWMTLMHWTKIKLSFLSRVWPELLSWTSYLTSVTRVAELKKLLCSWFLLLFFIFLLYGEKLRWLSFLLCQVKINRQNHVIFSTQRWYKHVFYFPFFPLFVPYRP